MNSKFFTSAEADVTFRNAAGSAIPLDTFRVWKRELAAASDSGATILDHFSWSPACGPAAGKDSATVLAECRAAAARLRRNHTWIAGFGPRASMAPTSDSAYSAFTTRALRYAGPLTGPSNFVGIDKSWQPLSPAERRQLPSGADWVAFRRPPTSPSPATALRLFPDCREAQHAYTANLPYLIGMDYPYSQPGGGVHQALLHWQLCGVPPRWILQTVTLNPAQALRATDSLGTVAAGKVADLVLLEGDPLKDIWNVSKIAAVVADGHYFDRAALDRLLLETAALKW